MNYNEYINSIIANRVQWSVEVKLSGLCERHHIVPRCDGGLPKNLNWKEHENVIWLYPDEHYIAHKLLYFSAKTKQHAAAWLMMAFPNGKAKRNFELTPDEYKELRAAAKENSIGSNNPMFGKKPWNKGLTKETDSRIAELSDKVSKTKLGVKYGPNSPEVKLHKSEAVRRRALEHPETFVSHNKGKICITDGVVSKYIDCTESIPAGFYRGQAHHKQYTIKDPEAYHEMRSKLTAGDKNGMYGKGYLLSNGNNGKATHRYYYKDIVFESAKEIREYLNSIGIPITKSAFIIFTKGEATDRLLNMYDGVLKEVRCVLKSEDYINN